MLMLKALVIPSHRFCMVWICGIEAVSECLKYLLLQDVQLL